MKFPKSTIDPAHQDEVINGLRDRISCDPVLVDDPVALVNVGLMIREFSTALEWAATPECEHLAFVSFALGGLLKKIAATTADAEVAAMLNNVRSNFGGFVERRTAFKARCAEMDKNLGRRIH